MWCRKPSVDVEPSECRPHSPPIIEPSDLRRSDHRNGRWATNLTRKRRRAKPAEAAPVIQDAKRKALRASDFEL